MPTSILLSQRLNRLLAKSTVSAVLAASLVACGDVASLLTPGSPSGAVPAQVAITASVAASVGAPGDVVALEVSAVYLRRNDTSAPLATQTRSLGGGATQALPIPVNLAACLSDAERKAASPQDKSCLVVFSLALLVNGAVIDRQGLGPLRLSPGTTTTVSEPVALYEIAAVQIALGGSPAPNATEPLAAVMGEALTLTATIKDRRGQLVADRSVVWSSDAPSVATIDAVSGKVTAVAVGAARITAAVGAVATTQTLRVLRSPAALTITAGPGSGSGTVRSTPAGIECRIEQGSVSGTCAFTFPGDARVLLTSTADAGSVTDLWGDACEPGITDGLCRVTMTQPLTMSSSFAALRRISIGVQGSDGQGRVTGPAGLDCRITGPKSSGVCAIDVREGTIVTLLATKDGPDAASAARQFFAGWGGVCSSATGETCTLTARTGPHVATVRFFDEQRLDVTLDGGGGGRVMSANGLACTRASGQSGGVCTQRVAFGSTVTFTAVPDSLSVFDEWRGACEGQKGTTCTTTITQSVAVWASFIPLRRLTVTAAPGDGRGRVTGIEGLDCFITGTVASGECVVKIRAGARLTLTATPESGSSRHQSFGAWGGDCASADGTVCDLSATDAPMAVSASFFDEQKIGVTLTGDGGGRVVMTAVGGIACIRANGTTSGVCAGSAMFGSSVTLTAMADPKSTFGGWSGECQSQSGTTCTTTLTKARTVSAIFTALRVALTLDATGPVAGTLVANDQTVCALKSEQESTRCVLLFDVGTLVTISGVPAANAQFAGFGGACVGTASCQVVMSAPRTVSARFEAKPPVALTVQLFGSGVGSVTGTGTLSCRLVEGKISGTCAQVVPFGTAITLSAAAGQKTRLVAWLGACAGQTGLTCTVTMTSSLSVSAEFASKP